MLKSLVRTLRGPSRDPRMAYVSRPMPRDLPDDVLRLVSGLPDLAERQAMGAVELPWT